MDPNQLKYQRLFRYEEEELEYKNYIVKLDFTKYVKRIIVRACCEEEIRDSTSYKIISIKRENETKTDLQQKI